MKKQKNDTVESQMANICEWTNESIDNLTGRRWENELRTRGATRLTIRNLSGHETVIETEANTTLKCQET